MKTMKYKFIADPGHGWLEVTRAELVVLGIESKISGFSYVKGTKVYLEEDCDMPLFLDALEAAGILVDFEEVYEENTPIRNYKNFLSWTPEPEVEAALVTGAAANG